MPLPPDKIASRLRAAVLASDHEKAERLTQEYTAALRKHWETLSSEERTASPLPKQSLELLGWVREMTIMHRAMASVHLNLLAKAQRYQTARAFYLQTAAIEPR